MANGKIIAICICPDAGAEMRSVHEVEAIGGQGLLGDRYSTGEGSFNTGKQGERQVTLINGIFFPGTGYEFTDSRRNIVTEGVELMWLIGRGDFQIGTARFRAVKYCDPCTRPNKLFKQRRSLKTFFRWLLGRKRESFKDAFHDRGGLIAEVIEGGIIRVGDPIIPPPKKY